MKITKNKIKIVTLVITAKYKINLEIQRNIKQTILFISKKIKIFKIGQQMNRKINILKIKELI